MTSISTLLQQAQTDLKSITDLPKLEAELLLSHLLHCTRTEFHTRPEREIQSDIQEKYRDLCQKRISGIPLAYLLGEQGFWKFHVKVTPNVLIPRADTELLVETALSLFADAHALSVLELGTGSGAIALALASEKSAWKITAVDVSDAALAIAKENAEKLNISHIVWKKSDWFSALSSEKFDLIISNPPYIAENDPHLEKLQHEPNVALVSGHDGLDAIKIIISEAKTHLNEQGYLLLEHGYNQAEAVQELLITSGFHEIKTCRDLGGNPRVTLGKKS